MSQPWLSPAPLIQRKIRRAAMVVTAAVVLLLMRFWYLQALEGRHYATLSAHNRLRLRPLEAPRGFILDRTGAVMVENRPSFNVHVIPADVPDVEEAAQAIGPLLGQASAEVAAR
ncbi:MAG: penicillin-binding protein 2, partial [candidate division NC10 bacterium]|nr:penicillin-binding protein 2 [candidate division NC10 bacterium]